MKTILLTQGYEAIVDDEDFDLVNQYKWHVKVDPNTQYAARVEGNHMHKQRGLPMHKNIRMHRFLMNPPDGLVVDHINGNGLDNRRSNLRICTRGENSRNYRIHREGKLPGIARKVSGKREYWEATVWDGKKRVYLGFANDIEGRDKLYKKYLDFVKKRDSLKDPQG